MCEIKFTSTDRLEWIRTISEVQNALAAHAYSRGAKINIEIDGSISPDDLHPVHLVLLACLVALFRKHNHPGRILTSAALEQYLRDQLHFDVYLTSNEYHVRSESAADLNLWQVAASRSLFYSNHVAEYLKNKYFRNKDLSLLKVVLDELYANIADHSLADDMAYSYIHYDEASRTVKIAFCDFGIGIPRSLARAGITAENGYIMKATGCGVSAKSNTHNKGFGLDTVVSSIAGTGHTIRIISGDELFISYGKDEHERTWRQPFYFNGTLIYFDLSIDTFDDIDYISGLEL